MLIDTHCHLYLEEFEEDVDIVIERAMENDVKKIILPNIDSRTVAKMNKLQSGYKNILYSTLGLHPTSVKEDFKDELANIFSNDISNIVAIGEIGIDLYWDDTFYKEQQEVLEFQLNFAHDNNLPVIIHSRNSMKEIFDVLSLYKNKGISGVFHCYPGDYEQAGKVIDSGFYLGIGGVLTYKKSILPEIISKIPLDYIITETDAPYLTPVPYRGKRNEPSYIKIIAEKISEIKKLDFNEVSQKTTQNAYKLFPKIRY
jgi:TatD DNase family protein